MCITENTTVLTIIRNFNLTPNVSNNFYTKNNFSVIRTRLLCIPLLMMESSYCLTDDYDHSDVSLEYVLENVLSKETSESNSTECIKLKELYNTLLINKCKCGVNGCCFSCEHAGNYVLDGSSSELVLNSENKSDLLYECSWLCRCLAENCLNRVVQRGPRKYLEVVESQKYKSKGVITTRDIPYGAFICEYAGELITRAEAMRRMRVNDEEHKKNYVLCLKERPVPKDSEGGVELVTIVDPAVRGNIGRYLNHSCNPNCQIFSVRIDSPIPKIAIFSKRFISAGEELCFHYNGGIQINAANNSRNMTPCLCGYVYCQKYLPNVSL